MENNQEDGRMTSFAITGIKYTKASSYHGYKSNYTSALPPIYEDASVFPVQSARDSTIRDLNLGARDLTSPGPARRLHHSLTFHNFEPVSNFPSDPVPGETTGKYVKQTSQVTRKGSRIGRLVKDRLTRNASKGNDGSSRETVEGSCSNQHENNLNNHRESSMDATNMEYAQFQKTEFVKPNNMSRRERSSSLYQVNPGIGAWRGRSYGYNIQSLIDRRNTQVLDDHFRWPKLDPEPPTDEYLLCPAEKKFRNRLFGVCYVFIVLMVILILVVTINGWVYPTGGGEVSMTNIIQTFEQPFLVKNMYFGNGTSELYDEGVNGTSGLNDDGVNGTSALHHDVVN